MSYEPRGKKLKTISGPTESNDLNLKNQISHDTVLVPVRDYPLMSQMQNST